MKGKTRSSVVDTVWKDVLQQADKSRLRKARQDAKNNGISDVRIQDGFIYGTVKASGAERGTFQVVLPWLADEQSHSSLVAVRLVRRPDWIAAHFAGVWESEFVQFLKERVLHVFPDETTWDRIEKEATCTCNDWQSVCAHKLALLCHLIADAEEHPLHIFQFVGLEASKLLEEAHRESATSAGLQNREDHRLAEVSGEEKTVDLQELLEEMGDVTPNGRLVPQFHPDKVKQWL